MGHSKKEVQQRHDDLMKKCESCGFTTDALIIFARCRKYRNLSWETYLKWIQSDNDQERKAADLCITMWEKGIKFKKANMNALRQKRAKGIPPNKLKLKPNSDWEIIGLSARQKDILLKRHNAWRKIYKAQPLVWDVKLQIEAQLWACEFAAMHGATLLTTGNPHSKTKYGENITRGSGPPPNGVGIWLYNAVEEWCLEYEVLLANPAGKHGHFTQVVWKASKKVGGGFVEMCINKTRYRIVVCNYDPPGNVVVLQHKVNTKICTGYQENIEGFTTKFKRKMVVKGEDCIMK